MKVHFGGRRSLLAAVLGAAAVFAIALLVALGGHSVVAGPGSAPAAGAPTPVGHEWSQVEGHGTGTGLWWLGTTVDQALELRVNNARALRLEPNATSPNVIEGYFANSVTTGAYGATIGGGGVVGAFGVNGVFDNFGTVGGGQSNYAGYTNIDVTDATYATVGGGKFNLSGAPYATVAGGELNAATDDHGAVCGGYSNQAGDGAGTMTDRPYATVGGGYDNTASGSYSTVPGGRVNTAQGDYSFAAGRRAKANHQGTFVWADSTDADFASTTADQFLVRASGGVSLNVTSGGLRLEPNATSPNVIGGYSGNSVTTNVVGATVSGGGASSNTNSVTDDYGTVGGGWSNQAGDGGGTTADKTYATVGGGYDNTASGFASTIAGGNTNAVTGSAATVGGGNSNDASGQLATIPGGYDNTAGAQYATVGGGNSNDASGQAATIAGGEDNTASGQYSTVPGGRVNTAAGDYSFAAGRQAKANAAGCFVWADSTAADLTCSTADQFLVRANGGVSLNVTSGGLRLESNATSPNVIGGYSGNSVTSGVYGAAICGGGGSSAANSATDVYGTVGGGYNNRAGLSDGSTSNQAYATVGGGDNNEASGPQATVAGGSSNDASNTYSAVGGGYSNDVSGYASTIGGGYDSAASGQYSTVAGGTLNSASGNYSFAAGRRAKANHQGAFVWADSTDADFASNMANQFKVRGTGGITLVANNGAGLTIYDDGTNLISTSTGAHLTIGGTWTNASSRDQKENFTPVDGQAVLASLAEVPITTWNSKAEDPSIRHMGPVAQDFYAAFGLGANDTSIGTLDADGVALAAIQGLYEIVQGLQAENADLEARVTALEGGTPANEGSAGPFSGLTARWLALGGLVVVGLVLAQRRRAGGPR